MVRSDIMAIDTGGRSIDGRWINNNETKEFRYGNNTREQSFKTEYQRIVEKLAKNKLEHELLFEGMINAQLRTLARDGITISREQLMADVNKEVAIQSIDFSPEASLGDPQIQSEIDMLKNNLGNMFGPVNTQSYEPPVSRQSIPREPAVASVYGAEDNRDTYLRDYREIQERTERSDNNSGYQDKLKENLVNSIIDNALKNGELSPYSYLPDIKKRLMEMSVEQLGTVLNDSVNQEERVISTGVQK